MSKFKIACIPAYNEQAMISDIIIRCKRFVDEVVVCDDGSTDDTAKKAGEAGATVLSHKKNVGKGGAMKTLFDYVKESDADVIVTIDGDGQFLPEEIPRLADLIAKDELDIVIGYRYENAKGMPSYRMFGNKMLDKITKMAADLPFRDTQSGFRAYSKKAADVISFSTNGFGVDSEILIDASKKGLVIAEEKVTVLYNTGGKTSTKNPVSHTSGVLGVLLESIAINHPLRYLGIPGTALIMVGIALGWYVLAVFDAIGYFSLPFTFASIVVLLIGILLILMSVVLFGITRIKAQK
ncbi:MAG: glycosyltransferase [Nitrosopumilus sp. H13]|nr:MAG: glycosyltransferase [Nitrosopumilus sp. H13]